MSSHTTRRKFWLLGFYLTYLVIAYVAGFGVYKLWNETNQINDPKPLSLFWEAWDLVEQNFYSEIPSPRKRTYGAIHSVLALLDDPYTVFVEPQPRELERDRMRGTFGGIGVTLRKDTEDRLRLFPYPDSPAERAGVNKGDILLAVDADEITGMTADAVSARLHGEVGTHLILTISRPTSEDPPTPSFDLTIMREEIQVPSVTWHALDQTPSIGYIHIKSFTERTGDELLKALQELQDIGTTELILDLRDNFGGLIDPAVDVTGQFLYSGVALYEINRDTQEQATRVQIGGIATETPLIVLVNGGTASAAEIVAGALQDHERAVLIGETTFGKASVQLIYEVSDGSSLHVTSALWLTPNHRRIEGQGLTPDIYVPPGNGQQLERAVTYLQSQKHQSD